MCFDYYYYFFIILCLLTIIIIIIFSWLRVNSEKANEFIYSFYNSALNKNYYLFSKY